MRYLFLILLLFSVAYLSFSQNKAEHYSVAAPLKMNVVYIGIDNPVEILAEGFSNEKLKLSVNNGTIKKAERYNYIVNPEKTGILSINVSTEVDGKAVLIGTHEFRVKRIPDPVPYIIGLRSGPIIKNFLWSQSGGIGARLDNFAIDLSFTVISYTFLRNVDGYSKEIKVEGQRFTPEVLSEISKCNNGEMIFFGDIVVSCPDGTIRNIGYISYKME